MVSYQDFIDRKSQAGRMDGFEPNWMPDFLFDFQRHIVDWSIRTGENQIPVSHNTGLLSYAGAREMPTDILAYRGMEGDQKKNLFSQWIWRQYASSVWDDIRGNTGEDTRNGTLREKGVLPHREAKDDEDEKHVHPLQLDVIERSVILWSNPGEVVLTPFMGVGSEVYGAVSLGRRGVGIELKPSYYNQAVKNLKSVNVVQESFGEGIYDVAETKQRKQKAHA